MNIDSDTISSHLVRVGHFRACASTAPGSPFETLVSILPLVKRIDDVERPSFYPPNGG